MGEEGKKIFVIKRNGRGREEINVDKIITNESQGLSY